MRAIHHPTNELRQTLLSEVPSEGGEARSNELIRKRAGEMESATPHGLDHLARHGSMRCPRLYICISKGVPGPLHCTFSVFIHRVVLVCTCSHRLSHIIMSRVEPLLLESRRPQVSGDSAMAISLFEREGAASKVWLAAGTMFLPVAVRSEKELHLRKRDK